MGGALSIAMDGWVKGDCCIASLLTLWRRQAQLRMGKRGGLQGRHARNACYDNDDYELERDAWKWHGCCCPNMK